MNILRIASQYLDLILQRRKKTTIRFGRRAVTENDRLLLEDYLGRQATVKITKVIVKRKTDFDVTDAMADGFRTLSELLSNLQQLYPESSGDDLFTVIKFEDASPIDKVTSVT